MIDANSPGQDKGILRSPTGTKIEHISEVGKELLIGAAREPGMPPSSRRRKHHGRKVTKARHWKSALRRPSPPQSMMLPAIDLPQRRWLYQRSLLSRLPP